MKTSTTNKIVNQITSGLFNAADTAISDVLQDNPRALKLVKKLITVAEDMVTDEFPVHVLEEKDSATEEKPKLPATVEDVESPQQVPDQKRSKMAD